jgi:Tfp pilus assembly protein PilF
VVGRNKPCPCGSGERFKDCCGSIARDNVVTAPAGLSYRPSGDDWALFSEADRMALGTLMESALRHQQAGELASAGALYRQVLAKAPATHDAWHMLGVVELGFRRLVEAEYSIRRALELRPEYPAIRTNLDLVLQALRTDNRAADEQRLCAKALPLLKWRVSDPANPKLADTDATDDRQFLARTGTLHCIGGVRYADDDDDWFVARLAEVLPDSVSVTHWHESFARLPTAARRGVPSRRVLRRVEAFPRGGTLMILDAMPEVDGWLEESCPDRVVLFCWRGNAAHYLDLIGRLNEATGARIELVFPSVSSRARFGLPGHVCVTPLALPLSPVAREDGRSERFVVGAVSDRDESTLPRVSGKLWVDLVHDRARVLLRGANRLRTKLGTERDVEFRSRQIESLQEFLSRLDCLVYHAPREWNEGRGAALFSAMALGIPVICSRQSQFAEYIEHERDGLVFDSDTDAREAVAELRRNPDRAEEIGAAARQKAARIFSPAALQAQYDFLLGLL